METSLVQLGLPVGTSPLPDAVPGAKVAATPPLSKADGVSQPKKDAPVAEQIAFDPKTSEESRQEDMQRASQMMQKDIFVVSDTKFAIYKDSTGQLVTRFTNLRDGSVTYIPEPDMMQYMEAKGRQRRAQVRIDV